MQPQATPTMAADVPVEVSFGAAAISAPGRRDCLNAKDETQEAIQVRTVPPTEVALTAADAALRYRPKHLVEEVAEERRHSVEDTVDMLDSSVWMRNKSGRGPSVRLRSGSRGCALL